MEVGVDKQVGRGDFWVLSENVRRKLSDLNI
jgi:hypothetical protein